MTQRLAVCVGINNYPGTNSDLSGCVNDARDWAAELKARGFSTTTLLDSQASKSVILFHVKDALRMAQPGDVVVFTFSGHGSWTPDLDGDEPDGRDEALCPYDFEHGLLTDDELYEVFTDRNPRVRLVFVSDSCHSGTVARFAGLDADAHSPKVKFLPPSVTGGWEAAGPLAHMMGSAFERFATQSRAKSSALLLSGCQDTEYSYDAWFGGRANGAFTKAALQAIRSAPKTYLDWQRGIRRLLPSTSYPQRPALVGTSTQKSWPLFG